MSAETDWLLDRIDTNYPEPLADVPLERVDREESRILEDDIRERTGELQDTNYVGAALATVDRTPIGTSYDHEFEAVVGMRIEGLHTDEWGHIDPTGADGVPWSELKRRIKRSILLERMFPDPGRTDVSYRALELSNEVDASFEHRDYYRHDFDVVFQGYEEVSGWAIGYGVSYGE